MILKKVYIKLCNAKVKLEYQYKQKNENNIPRHLISDVIGTDCQKKTGYISEKLTRVELVRNITQYHRDNISVFPAENGLNNKIVARNKCKLNSLKKNIEIELWT